MWKWLHTLLRAASVPRAIPDGLWQKTLADYPFLAQRSAADQQRLRQLASEFLGQKQFHGAQGLVVTDAMAVAIAAQACLPILHLGLRWYDDFKGIVVHPGQMLARRVVTDAIGLVHGYSEVLAGEAMERGPVTLSWQDVAAAGEMARHGYNVVVHEFAHKLDMRDGAADGCPPLPSRQAHATWRAVWLPVYEAFRERVTLAERFGAEPPWLDAYGATSPAEFFAVACEAYFVSPERFAQEFASLVPLLDRFFKKNRA